jgi:hypothetical protein
VPDPNPQQQETAPRRDDRRDDRPAPQAVPQTPDMVWADEFEDHGWREQSEEQLRQAQAQREHALQARQAVNALEATTEPPAGQPAPVQARIDQMNARARAQEIQTQGVTGVPPRSAAEARRARGQPER